MQDLTLFIKSYSRDVLRVARLMDSIERFNRDALPVVVSRPQADAALFEQQLGRGRCTFIDDEAIAAVSPGAPSDYADHFSGGLVQQILKSEFWRLGTTANWLCIDSDSRFIQSFGRDDFLHPDGHPYTVIHQNKELLQMAANLGIGKVAEGFAEEAARFRALLPRPGPEYVFMPSPFLWSARVWQSLEAQWLQPRGETLWQAITPAYPESRWYGEALLAFGAIALRPVEPYFRVYHYDWQYDLFRRQGETEASLRAAYLGIVLQSNWDDSLDYGAPRKSWASRAVRRLKRGLRRWRSFS